MRDPCPFGAACLLALHFIERGLLLVALGLLLQYDAILRPGELWGADAAVLYLR